MSAPPSGGGAPIENRRQLIEYFAAGNKPRAQWRMGTEHEKFGFNAKTLKPLPYDGETGVRAMLEGLTRFGWEPVTEGNNPIALLRGKANITLEPGGQFELSGAPLETLHETADENEQHIREVKQVAEEIGAGYIGLGFAPEWKREDIHWMPKGRYKIMREYMPKRGKLGLDMMLRTCTVQTNLDFESEADMVKKLRVALALQPVGTALFANSPFTEGKPNGLLSFRSEIWRDTDNNRAGMLPFVFEPGFGFERYADYMLDVPMYFVYRDGKYIDASGQSFKDFLQGKLPARPGELPTINDWADHVTTAFEVGGLGVGDDAEDVHVEQRFRPSLAREPGGVEVHGGRVVGFGDEGAAATERWNTASSGLTPVHCSKICIASCTSISTPSTIGQPCAREAIVRNAFRRLSSPNPISSALSNIFPMVSDDFTTRQFFGLGNT